MTITQTANANRPFTLAGERGGIFGQQDGSCELWLFPVKILEHLHITAQLEDYPVPIDVNAQASTIQVSPDHTTITYSHAAIVVRQMMFAPRARASDVPAGAMIVFDIQSTRRASVFFRFDPALVPQWPAPNYGRPSASWRKIGDGGGFLLETSSPHLSGIVAMPGTVASLLPPYQERPAAYPLELKLEFDPTRDKNVLFPLLAAVVYDENVSPTEIPAKLTQQILTLNEQVAQLYARTRDYYLHFFDNRVVVDGPDITFNQAFRWAEVAVDQSRVLLKNEPGLVAGWYPSGASARPGYGWFFGRDTLWSLFAIDSYGDYSLARDAMTFLIRRQRADGKIMHEYSQTAGLVEWSKFPYWYAAADSTPLFVMAMADYVQTSGDLAFLRQQWSHVKQAYTFTRTHDSDGDGVYDNSQGTGWVESWVPRMPDQELYLAALDEQSSEAMSWLAKLMAEQDLSGKASAQAKLIRDRVNAYRQANGFYAFSKDANGSYDATPTIFPSVAWWTGTLSLPDAEPMLSRWASHEFSTDWGLRSVSEQSSIFDPLSYHQGTVWPLFTGWVAMAEYRAGRPLTGYQQLMSSMKLTYAQDPGGITELLSGTFDEPLGRSSSRQMWSSAMVISVVLRGMLGIDADVLQHTIHVSPAMPGSWDQVHVRHVPFGAEVIDLTLKRSNGNLVIDATSTSPQVLCLVPEPRSTADRSCNAAPAVEHSATVPLRPIEVFIPEKPPLPGSRTQDMKVLEEHYSTRRLTLVMEAAGGTVQSLDLRVNSARTLQPRVTGGKVEGNHIRITFPSGSGYQKQNVVIEW